MTVDPTIPEMMMPRAPQDGLAVYPPKAILLANGATLVVRQAELSEVDRLLRLVEPLRWVPTDHYDVISAQLFADMISWRAGLSHDPYCLVGTIAGELAGVVTGREVDATHGMSYHTLALVRGLRIGAYLFAAKMEHHFEVLGHEEVWVSTVSPLGHRRWLAEYALEQRRRYDESPRGSCWVLTRDVYLGTRPSLVTGTRPVAAELLAESRELRAPDLAELTGELEHTLEARL